MNLTLKQGPEGAPNSSFGLYDGDRCVEFVEWSQHWPGMATTLGWVPCSQCNATDGTVDCEHHTASEMMSAAFDFLEARDGQEFELSDYARPDIETVMDPDEAFEHEDCPQCGYDSIPAEGVPDQSLRCCPACEHTWFEGDDESEDE